MTQDDKAARYDELLRKADVVNRELSRLKSANAGVNTTSDSYNQMVTKLNSKLASLESQLQKLFIDG